MVKASFRTYILVMMITLVGAFHCTAETISNEEHMEVVMRMIGHQILLKSGDSLSRVLPIGHEEGSYTINFESGFAFKPEELAATIDQVVLETKMASSYVVQVRACGTGEVVYSYEVGKAGEGDIVPCASRELHKACYAVVISIKDDTSALVNTRYSTIALPILAVLLALLLYAFFKQRKDAQASDPHIIHMGSFLFDKRSMQLFHDQKPIDLSGKEADLLLLLHDSANHTVEREVILKAVWGDEGAYVGRTLDVFISKLRKKLEADASLKIANIRGVGYRLIVNG